MTQKLVSQSTVSSKDPVFDCSNRQCIEILANWLDMRKFSVEIIPSDNLPEKLNLVAVKGNGDNALVFSGHIDTVPYDESKWSSNPFTLTERDNRWYGLGVCDMKGFFPIVIEAAQRFDFKKSAHPITIVATADEESTMSGMMTLLSLNKPTGAYTIIGEPTDLIPVRMNKGIMMVALTVHGIAGHSSNPEAGRNAIDGMWNVLKELMNIREKLKKTYNNLHFEIPYPTLNFGRIFGGDSANRICPSCTIHFDLRVLPGMEIDTIYRDIYKRLTQLAESEGFSLSFENLFPGVGAMETTSNSPIIKEAEKFTGKKAEAVPFATEGYFFTTLGMDTLILGPGDIRQAHRPDEYLKVERIMPALDLYSSLIKTFCFNPS